MMNIPTNSVLTTVFKVINYKKFRRGDFLGYEWPLDLRSRVQKFPAWPAF